MDREPNKIKITRQFVDRWSARFDDEWDPQDAQTEEHLKGWLAQQKGPRFLNKGRFLDVATWKSRRPKRYYKRNSSSLVREVTKLAFKASEDRLRLHILTALEGVGVPVASTILHFAFPHRYAILDVRVVSTLTRAGLWSLDKARSFTVAAWLEYIQLMRGLSAELRVDLRTLDKALWAFDKYGGKVRQGEPS